MAASLQNAGDGTTAPKEATYSDPSGTIFSMYISRALKFDDENVENWKGGADSILVFTGVFSSTVATFIAMSYPSLQQDPNIITQSLLVTISQQLATPNGTSPAASPSLSQSSFSPSAPVIFVNSVWFLSLVLSLTCALIATLLQQWARRYLQMIQRNHAPHVRAHIREYFSRGARKFRIFVLVETLPFLILVSVLLFFAGLVVFAFLANHIVAYITLAIVAICFVSYIIFSLTPLRYHDCPYYTPFTSLLWYSAQIIPLSFFSVLYRGAEQLHDRWGTVSEGRISKLENSAKQTSMDIYKEMLVRTLHWLSEDHELEEFVAGIPGLCEPNAVAMHDDNDDTKRTFRDVLAVLPGPMGFHASLPWSIIQLAQRTFTSKLPKSVQQPRTRACLRALYDIPGAIRDVLAPYAAGKHYCLEILPLLNTPESLEIIGELWDTPNDDVALSVRCAAAVAAAFMITPPRRTLDNFVTPDVGYIWDDNTGKQFLEKRFRFGTDADGDVPHPNSDSARLQNLRRFLADIGDALRYTNPQWWTSTNAGSVRRVRRKLFDTRRTDGYRTGHGTFDQQGDRASTAFVPAAQQDLITLTLEILARDPVAGATKSQREAALGAYKDLEQVTSAQARSQGREEIRTRMNPSGQEQVQVEPEVLMAAMQARVADSFGVFKSALEPVLQVLQPNSTDNGLAPARAPSAKLPPPVSPPLLASSSSAPVTGESGRETGEALV
ncbi:hypothetical protein EDB85DRAFT_900820 [Lactarius pseudohatsudake]|nr:hypothetical protein EDB85DRAFT_900820 [Lactarius pseudohatsudake]